MAKPASTVTRESSLEPQVPEKELGPIFQAAAGPAKWADDRLGLSTLGRSNLRKIFPDHWSFLLGEVALYSFIICLVTGVFLTLWYKPSMGEVEYEGTYQLLRGLEMSEAYSSTVALSFDIRGGLLMRQIHHWGAMLFLAAMLAHSLRVFFTGAFRKPREVTWLLGVALLSVGLIEGFAGYSLPDDLLSGTGLRFVDGLLRSVPLVGTWLEFLVFGGQYPGELIVPRLYMAHILLIPAILAGLIVAHIALVVYNKHTQFPGPGRTEDNVVGYPLFPVYMAKAGGFFFIVAGVLVLMGALLQINPVWTYGPYNPAEVSAGAQPDWYMGFVEGAVRIMPNWEWHIGGTTWSWNVFIPGAGLMLLFFGLMAIYPFAERWVTGDASEHHILDRPRNNATRTAFGVAAMTCYGMFWAGGGNDIIATQFAVSLNSVTYFLRVAVFVAPVIAFLITKRICVGLQRADAEKVLHGSESGIIVRDPSGSYAEKHAPISHDMSHSLTQFEEPLPLTDGTEKDYEGVSANQARSERLRRKATRFYFQDNLRKPSRAEIEAAHHHAVESGNGHGELEPGGEPEVAGVGGRGSTRVIDGNGHHRVSD